MQNLFFDSLLNAQYSCTKDAETIFKNTTSILESIFQLNAEIVKVSSQYFFTMLPVYFVPKGSPSAVPEPLATETTSERKLTKKRASSPKH